MSEKSSAYHSFAIKMILTSVFSTIVSIGLLSFVNGLLSMVQFQQYAWIFSVVEVIIGTYGLWWITH
jgi:hypothetical protein